MLVIMRVTIITCEEYAYQSKKDGSTISGFNCAGFTEKNPKKPIFWRGSIDHTADVVANATEYRKENSVEIELGRTANFYKKELEWIES